MATKTAAQTLEQSAIARRPARLHPPEARTMATIPARTATGRRCQTEARSATSVGIASASMRMPNRSAWSGVTTAMPRPERAGGQTASPFASPSKRPRRKVLLPQGLAETASNPTPSAWVFAKGCGVSRNDQSCPAIWTWGYPRIRASSVTRPTRWCLAVATMI